MALSGRKTLTVLMADRFSLSMSRLYSRALEDREKGKKVTICRPHQCPVTEKKIILWSPRCARRRARRLDGYLWPCGSRSPGRFCRKNEQPENNISLKRFLSTAKGSQFCQEIAQILGKSSPLFSIPKICLFPFPPYFPKVVPAAEKPPRPRPKPVATRERERALPHFSLVKKCDQN